MEGLQGIVVGPKGAMPPDGELSRAMAVLDAILYYPATMMKVGVLLLTLFFVSFVVFGSLTTTQAVENTSCVLALVLVKRRQRKT